MSLFSVEGLTIEIVRGDSEQAQTVIRDVAFSLEPGEAVALVGESGSGKSLVALGSIDLLPPGARVVSGTTRFEGIELQELDEADWRRLVGMGIGVLLQDAIGSWDPTYIVGLQSGEVFEEHDEEMSIEEIRERVLKAFGEAQLPKRFLFGALAEDMSRGQAQRAMLATTMLTSTRILIADEPLSGLDVTTARAVLDLIDDLRRKRGMAMLLVTHDLAVVAGVADRVAVMYGGMIVEEADTSTLFRTPRHPYTSGLLRSVPGFGVTRLEPIPGESPNIWEILPGCPFAPRCAHAVDDCRRVRPDLRPIDGSQVACLRSDYLDLPGIG